MVLSNVQLVELVPGLMVQWSPAHDLFVSQITDISAATVDCWYAANTGVMTRWPANEPYRALLDFATNDHIYVTPRAKAYAERLFHLRPGLEGRMALLIRPSISAQSIQIFVARHATRTVLGGVFFDRDRALSWLLEGR